MRFSWTSAKGHKRTSKAIMTVQEVRHSVFEGVGKLQRAFARHREQMSVCIDDVLLSICFGRSRRLRRQLKHRCLLPLT
jgi:hypothetical protein